MGQKTITFYEERYWDSPGCSCCIPDEWIVWNTDTPLNGSCSSREDCYISAMEYFGYPIRAMTDEDCWEYSEDELESICREYKIEVVFEI